MKNYSYFDLRGVDPTLYSNVVLPSWMKEILANSSKNISILDYGCGYGQNMQALRNEGFKNVYGLDLDEKAINYCKKNNFKVLNIAEDNFNEYLKNKNNKFDVIILSHVLEHIPKDDMQSALEGIYKLLKANGFLLIAVPNGQSSTGSYWMWEDFTHQWLFTSGSLKYILFKSGFSKIKFVDIYCTSGMKLHRMLIKKFLIKTFIKIKTFINRINSSPYHKPSVDIFSFEIKAIAEK